MDTNRYKKQLLFLSRFYTIRKSASPNFHCTPEERFISERNTPSMPIPGLQALGLTPQSFQFAGLNGNNSIQAPGLSTQDPQALGGPSAGLQALSGLPPVSPSFTGSGQSNFAGNGIPNAFASLPQVLAPSKTANASLGNQFNVLC
jgi:hypothetical protein